VLAFVPVAILGSQGMKAEDMYPLFGTLSVYGFMTSYGLVAVALPFHLKKVGRLSVLGVGMGVAAAVASLVAMAGTMYPLPEGAYLYLPYIYLAYMVAGMSWWWGMARKSVG
jgi:amino acid transporter